jgi:hypothetical protein
MSMSLSLLCIQCNISEIKLNKKFCNINCKQIFNINEKIKVNNKFKIDIKKEVEEYYSINNIVPRSTCKEFVYKSKKVKTLFGSWINLLKESNIPIYKDNNILDVNNKTIHTIDNLTIYYETGVIISKTSNQEMKFVDKDGYIIINKKDDYGNFKRYKAHRYVYENYYNIKLTQHQIINHIDHNRSNNSIFNLEVVTYQENTQWRKTINPFFNIETQKYQIRIVHPITKKRIFIGNFSNKEEGIAAYNEFANNLNIEHNSKYYTYH